MTPIAELKPIVPFYHPEAACTGLTDLFFPDEEKMARAMVIRTIEGAKEVCRSCRALDACRDYVMAHPPRHGVWAGMTEKQIRVARKRASGE